MRTLFPPLDITTGSHVLSFESAAAKLAPVASHVGSPMIRT